MLDVLEESNVVRIVRCAHSALLAHTLPGRCLAVKCVRRVLLHLLCSDITRDGRSLVVDRRLTEAEGNRRRSGYCRLRRTVLLDGDRQVRGEGLPLDTQSKTLSLLNL